MEEPKKETLALAAPAAGLTPEYVAEIVARVLGKFEGQQPTADEIPAVLATTGEKVLVSAKPDFPEEVGHIGSVLTEVGQYAGTLVLSSPHRLKSRKLWAMIGTVAVLLSQAPLGYQLPPVTQWIIGVVAAVYIAAQGVVDSAAKPRPLEPAA